MTRLSNSGVDKYEQCPKKWYYHYVDGIRDRRVGSALFVGGYIGQTLEMILFSKKDELTPEEEELRGTDPYEYFDRLMSSYTERDSGETFDLADSELVRYYKSDYNPEIYQDIDLELIKKYREEFNVPEFDIMEQMDQYKKEKLSNSMYSYINFCIWLSLRRKGHMIIDAYFRDIHDNIKRVYATEKEINLDNGCGDTVIGYIDLIVDWQTEDMDEPKKILFDFKTSSSKYALNSVLTSQQLSLYDYVEKIGTCGYIVFIKKLAKARNKEVYSVKTQVVIDEIPMKDKVNVVRNIDNVLTKIDNAEFPKNKASCFAYGRLCEYASICNYGERNQFHYTKGDK